MCNSIIVQQNKKTLSKLWTNQDQCFSKKGGQLPQNMMFYYDGSEFEIVIKLTNAGMVYRALVTVVLTAQ